MDLETRGGRLSYFIVERYNDNDSAFARAAGIKSVNILGYRENMKQPGADALEGFMRAGLNPLWYLTGEGGEANMDYRPDTAERSAVIERRKKIEEGREVAARLEGILEDLRRLG